MDRNILIDLQMPERVILEKEIENRYHGIFVIEPLEKGYGITIGNSLRRVIYSSLRGYAITFIRIEWEDQEGNRKFVASEFDNIPFVVEDTIDIIMNLKQIRLKLLDGSIKKSFNLTIEGPKTVRAGDFEVSSEIQVVNKDFEVIHIEQEGKLEIEFTIENGKGFIPAEKRLNEINEIGKIPIDAIFNPVKNVNFKIEPTRVKQITDYEKLTIDITTDGTIDPEEALESAAFILTKYFEKFIKNMIPIEDLEVKKEEKMEVDETEKKILEYLNESLDKLEFTERVKNCFKAAAINTFEDLLVKTENELSQLRNFGKKSLTEVVEKLKSLGFKLGMKEEIERIKKKYNKE